VNIEFTETYRWVVPAGYLENACCLLPKATERTDPSALELPGAKASQPAARLLDRLTPAERLVAVHIAQGLSNKEISAALSSRRRRS
jgi:DNA-binding NarL/FixJ family response regulator